jgi:hypothetical protein
VHETATDATPLSYAELLATIFAVKRRNGEASAAMMSVREEQLYAGFTASDGQPLRAPAVVDELPKLSSTSVPTDLGAGTNESIMTWVSSISSPWAGRRSASASRVRTTRTTSRSRSSPSSGPTWRCCVRVRGLTGLLPAA